MKTPRLRNAAPLRARLLLDAPDGTVLERPHVFGFVPVAGDRLRLPGHAEPLRIDSFHWNVADGVVVWVRPGMDLLRASECDARVFKSLGWQSFKRGRAASAPRDAGVPVVLIGCAIRPTGRQAIRTPLQRTIVLPFLPAPSHWLGVGWGGDEVQVLRREARAPGVIAVHVNLFRDEDGVSDSHGAAVRRQGWRPVSDPF